MTNEDASKQDFHKPLQTLAAAASSKTPLTGSKEQQTGLEGTILGLEHDNSAGHTHTTFSSFTLPQLPSRKSLAKQLKLTTQAKAAGIGEEIMLKRLMSRPPETASGFWV